MGGRKVKRADWHQEIIKRHFAAIKDPDGEYLTKVTQSDAVLHLRDASKMLDKFVEMAREYEKLRGWTKEGIKEQPLDHGEKARQVLAEYEKGEV